MSNFYARTIPGEKIGTNIVVEVVTEAAYETFNPTTQEMFIACPDGTAYGWTYTPPSSWVAPPPPPPAS